MKLKKLLCLALTLIMVVSALSVVTVSAEGDLDDHLLIHWDFEGETLEEQLSNKVDGKTANLVLEGESEANGIVDGIATVGNGVDNQLVYRGSEAIDAGEGLTELDECDDEYTMVMVMEVDAVNSGGWIVNPGSNAYFYYHAGANTITSSILFQPTGSSNVQPRYRMFWSRGNGPVNDSVNTAIAGYNVFVVSVKYDYNASEELVPWATVYVNGEYTGRYDAAPGTDEIMTAASTFAFGNGSLTTGLDFGVWANYDDIRFYDKALDDAEALALSTELMDLAPAPDSVDPGDFTFGSDTTATAGDNTTAAADDTTAAAGDDTTAAADDDTAATTVEKEKSGCGAAIMGMALIPATVAIGAAIVSRKKRD